jgi:3-dehydrosphinganine reductase
MARDIRKGFYFGKKVFITGGSSGIGLSMARQVAQKGGHVWLVARDPVKLEKACGEVKQARFDPSQIVGFSVADVSVESQAKAAVEQATKSFGFPDIVVNNAGITHPGYFQDLDAEIFRQMMDVNYFGTLNVTRAVVPEMIRKGGGDLVNVSSGVAFLAVFGYSAYAASKWAIRGFSDVLRSELKQHGIRLHIAMPPDTDTPQLAGEESIKPEETKIIASTNKVYSPEKVAKDILDGVVRNRYIILTGLDTIFFYWLSNLLGPLQYPVMDMVVGDAVKKAKKIREGDSKRV